MGARVGNLTTPALDPPPRTDRTFAHEPEGLVSVTPFPRKAAPAPREARRSGSALKAADGRSARYEALDSLRGVCALLVAAYHFNPAAVSLLGPLLGSAYLFVDFFFVLSGFVIAHSYGERLRGAKAVEAFAVRRLARLYPLHLFVLLLYVALECLRLAGLDPSGRAPFTGTRSVSSLLANLGLVQGIGVADGLSWNGVSWSISAEFWTYLVFAGVVLASGRARLPVFAALAAASLAALLLLAPATMNVTFDYGLIRCLAGFFIGAALHEAFFRKPRHAAGGTNAARASAMEIAVVAGCVLFVALAGSTRLSLAGPLVFAAAVALFANGRGLVSRALELPALVRLGTLSYAIYMLHAFGVYVLNTLAKLVERATGLPLTAPFMEDGQAFAVFRLPSPALMDLAALGFLAAVVAAAALVHRTVEIPGRDAVLRLLGAPRKPSPGALGSELSAQSQP